METNKKDKEAKSFNAKKMLEENGKNGTKIRYNDRMKVEIITPTKHLKVGTVFSPHLVKAKALIEQGFAKEVKS